MGANGGGTLISRTNLNLQTRARAPDGMGLEYGVGHALSLWRRVMGRLRMGNGCAAITNTGAISAPEECHCDGGG